MRIFAILWLFFSILACRTQDNIKAKEQQVAEGTRKKFTHSVTLKAPPEKIWSIWMDVENWHTWDTELKEAKADSPLSLGVRGKLTTKEGTTSDFTVTEFKENDFYTIEVDLPLAILKITRNVKSVNGFSRFNHTVEFSGPFGGFFAFLLGDDYRKVLPEVMANIERQVLDSMRKTK